MKLQDYLPLKEEISLGFELRPITLLIALMTIGLILFYLYGVFNFFMHGHHAYNVTRELLGDSWLRRMSFVAVAMGSIVHRQRVGSFLISR